MKSGVQQGVAVDLAQSAPSLLPPSTRSSPAACVVGFVALAALLAAAGAVYLHKLKADFQLGVEKHLAVMTDLKLREALEWRRNLLDDAQAISLNPFLADHLQEYFAGPAKPDLTARFSDWLAAERVHNQARRAVLTDPRVRLSAPDPARELDATGQAFAEKAIRSNLVVISDFHRLRDTGYVHLDLAIPLRAPGTNHDSGLRGRPTPAIGALSFEVDPTVVLFPLLESWPAPEPSGETLLVRREGDWVLFLNELRQRTNGALALRIPLSSTNTIAVRAALGGHGISAGLDDRGVPVLACVRAVPGTGWWLVSKIDRAEAFAGFQTEQRHVLAALAAFISLAGLGAMALRRKREATRLRAELALESQCRALTQRVLEITRHAHDIVFLVDEQAKILDANDRAREAYGYSLKEFRGLKAADLRAPGAREDLSANLADLKPGPGVLFETVHARKDGTLFPAEVSVRIVELDRQKYYQAFVRDITERCRNEEQLRKLSRAVEQSPASIVVTDAEGRIEYVNPKFCALTGYTAAEVLGQNPRVLKSGRIPRETFHQLWATIQAGNVWRGELHNRKKNGELYWEFASISPIRTPEGRITHFVAVKEDITERKRMEEERARLAAIIEATPDHVCLVDARDHHVLYLNRAGRRMAGLGEAEDVSGLKLDDFIPGHARDLAYNVILPTALRTGVWTGETSLVRRNGEEVPVLMAFLAHKSANGEVEVLSNISRDVALQKQAEAELNTLHQQLVDTAHQSGMAEIATSVLHNVGNILTSVVVSSALVSDRIRTSKLFLLAKTAALLQDHAKDLPKFFAEDPKARLLPDYVSELAARLTAEHEEIAGELSSLASNVEHIKEIVAMQQSYAGVAGVSVLVSLNDLLEDAYRINAAGFERRHVKVGRQYAELPRMYLEKHKVVQILVNLISNAKNALDETAVADKQLLLRTELVSANRVRVSVIDNGMGISEENLKNIFSFGFTTRKHGHGFGLHNGSLVAKEMGGALSANSDGPDQGATFILELPFETERRRS